MLKFLKKYKYSLLFLSLFLCADIFILPKQESYYFDYDIEDFKTTSFHVVLFIFELVIFTFIVIAAIKVVRALEDYVIAFFNLIYAMAVTFFVTLMLHSMFLCGALYLNRQVTKGEVKRTFLVESKEIRDGNKYGLFLYEPALHKSLVKDFGLTKSQYDGINQYDKIELSFTKGWFELDYSPQYAGKVK